MKSVNPIRILKGLGLVALLVPSLVLGILAVSPSARAEAVNMGLPCSWGSIDTPFWTITENGQFRESWHLAIASTNETLTSTSPSLIYLTSMSGNHTLTLPTVAAVGPRSHFRIIAATNAIGTTGNLTLNVTSSGNINTIDSLTVSNTSGATGAVQWIDAYADKTTGTNDWFVGVTRR